MMIKDRIICSVCIQQTDSQSVNQSINQSINRLALLLLLLCRDGDTHAFGCCLFVVVVVLAANLVVSVRPSVLHPNVSTVVRMRVSGRQSPFQKAPNNTRRARIHIPSVWFAMTQRVVSYKTLCSRRRAPTVTIDTSL